jgi:hypothetical protein
VFIHAWVLPAWLSVVSDYTSGLVNTSSLNTEQGVCRSRHIVLAARNTPIMRIRRNASLTRNPPGVAATIRTAPWPQSC